MFLDVYSYEGCKDINRWEVSRVCACNNYSLLHSICAHISDISWRYDRTVKSRKRIRLVFRHLQSGTDIFIHSDLFRVRVPISSYFCGMDFFGIDRLYSFYSGSFLSALNKSLYDDTLIVKSVYIDVGVCKRENYFVIPAGVGSDMAGLPGKPKVHYRDIGGLFSLTKYKKGYLRGGRSVDKDIDFMLNYHERRNPVFVFQLDKAISITNEMRASLFHAMSELWRFGIKGRVLYRGANFDAFCSDVLIGVFEGGIPVRCEIFQEHISIGFYIPKLRSLISFVFLCAVGPRWYNRIPYIKDLFLKHIY